MNNSRKMKSNSLQSKSSFCSSGTLMSRRRKTKRRRKSSPASLIRRNLRKTKF